MWGVMSVCSVGVVERDDEATFLYNNLCLLSSALAASPKLKGLGFYSLNDAGHAGYKLLVSSPVQTKEGSLLRPRPA